MKKIVSILLLAALTVASVFALSSCSKKIKIGIPNDPTNEARALELLEVQGLITLKENLDTFATVLDIAENPYDIDFMEIEAAQLPRSLNSLDYAVINSNYAIEAKITPFVTEGTDVSYPNIIAVKEDNADAPLTKALVAAVNSKAVADFIASEYSGAIVCDLKNSFADGTDPTVDYNALAGQTIKIAASPTPHADILNVAKQVLAGKGITLEIVEFEDYIQPNLVVNSGEFYANFFQHVPYLTKFNEENKTHIVSVLEVHHEPMGVYSSKYDSFDAIKNAK